MRKKVVLNQKFLKLLDRISDGTATPKELAQYEKKMRQALRRAEKMLEDIEKAKRVSPEIWHLFFGT